MAKPQGNYKLVIFDMDGTLIDSVSRWVELFEKVLSKYHIHVPRDHLISTFGRQAPETIRMLIPNGLATEATDYFMSHQRDHIDSIQAFPHSKEVLMRLKAKGYKTAIATGNNRDLMHYFLQKFGLEEYIDFCICSQDVKHCKPNPEMLLKILEHFQVKPEEAFYVADSPMDFLAGKSAHIKLGIVTTGVLCEERAKELKPECVFSDLRELEKMI